MCIVLLDSVLNNSSPLSCKNLGVMANFDSAWSIRFQSETSVL